MKYRAVLLLILLVLLPLLLLGWLGYRLQQNEQQLVGLQLQKLIEQQLESVDQQLQTHFQQLESLLQRQAADLYRLADKDYSTEQLRQFVKRSPQVQQLFVLGPDDRRQFPPPGAPLSLDEQQLVERLQPLWQSPGLFRPAEAGVVEQAATTSEQATLWSAQTLAAADQDDPMPAPEQQRSQAPALSKSSDYFASGQLVQRAPAELSAPVNDYAAKAESRRRVEPAAPAPDSAVARERLADFDAVAEAVEEIAAEEAERTAEPASSPIASGWIAWYVDARLMHIFWWRDPAGRTLGFVLDATRLQADLFNRLPDARAGSDALGEAQIRLLDSQSQPLYSWGQYRDNGPALRSLGLSHPLGSWSLEYHAPALQQAAAPLWLTLIAPLVLLGVGLVALGYGLYREQRRELDLASQRVNFVNQVSHELKTPLTNVRLYAEMLEQRLEGDEDTAVNRYLGVITSESQRLSLLIDNVLSFARLQRQQPQPAMESADPDEQIGRILDTFAPLLRQRGIEPRFTPGIGQCLQYDPATLEQILNNLLSNCEKYAPDSGELWLRSRLEGRRLCIEVEDAGPGIAPEEQTRVFEPFYRSSSRLSDGITGTGIGLGLARDLARAHGGDLTLEAGETGAHFLIELETAE